MSVRMSHPDSGGEYLALPEQVPHLIEAGWEVEPGQQEQGEEWPDELKRFEGQQQVHIRHPVTGGEAVIAESAWPFHAERGWDRVDQEPVVFIERALEDLTVEELKEELRALDLPVSGTKAELVERLRPATTGQEPAEQPSEPPAEPATKEE